MKVDMGPKRQSNAPAYTGQIEESPLGAIWVAVSDQGLVAVEIGVDPEVFEARLSRKGYEPVRSSNQLLSAAIQQIMEYLAGARKEFDLPIDWSRLTSFNERVLKVTYAIPYGETRTYGEIAVGLGKPGAARAVGRAEATNPMPLVVPCHRVVGSDGGLHGYGAPGGIETKAWLLSLEGSN
jgi:methylated-DNA-[protein]-cysteine S-methyltransferase